MNEEDPLVSVCIPCYNAEKTIAETLDSILAQTYSNVEIIVSDNQSTDNTQEVVLGYAKQGVRLVVNPPVKDGDGRIFGAFDNWDYALSQGKGDFVCLYHADDLYDSEIIEKELSFLQSHSEVGAVLTLRQDINKKGDKIKSSKRFWDVNLHPDAVYGFNNFLPMILTHGHFVNTPSLMVKKEVISVVGKFDEARFASAADLDYFMRISKNYKLGIIQEKLLYYRITDTHTSAMINRGRTKRADYFIVTGYYIEDYGRNKLPSDALHMYQMHLKNDQVRCSWYLWLQGESFQAKDNVCSVVDMPWIWFSMRSFHGVMFIGVCILIYGSTLIKADGMIRKTVCFWKKR